MELRTHPILKELQVNEDGSVVIYKGKQMEVKTYFAKGRDNYPSKRVCFRNRVHSLARLVCECWNGRAEHIDQKIQRKDFNPLNYHYTNLYWADGNNNRTIKMKRSKSSKIKESDIQDILDRIERNEPLTCIAASYNTSRTSIYRIKKSYLTNKWQIFKRQLIKAHDGHGRRLAYAQYLNFKSIQEAIDTIGRREFIDQCNNLMI